MKGAPAMPTPGGGVRSVTSCSGVSPVGHACPALVCSKTQIHPSINSPTNPLGACPVPVTVCAPRHNSEETRAAAAPQRPFFLLEKIDLHWERGLPHRTGSLIHIFGRKKLNTGVKVMSPKCKLGITPRGRKGNEARAGDKGPGVHIQQKVTEGAHGTEVRLAREQEAASVRESAPWKSHLSSTAQQAKR